MTLKTKIMSTLDRMSKEAVTKRAENIIKKDPSGGYKKLASTGITDSEKDTVNNGETGESNEDEEEEEHSESFAFNGGPYGKAYLDMKAHVAKGFQGTLKTMMIQMEKGGDGEEMLKKYRFDKNPEVAKRMRALHV